MVSWGQIKNIQKQTNKGDQNSQAEDSQVISSVIIRFFLLRIVVVDFLRVNQTNKNMHSTR